MMHVRNTKNDTSMAVAEEGACLESEDSAVNHEKRTKGERDSNTGIPMHPLLFQAPENATPPYYPRNSSGLASTSLNFFSPNPPQLNLSLFHNSSQQNQVVTHFYTSPKPSCSTFCVDGIDFHPLLGRTDSTSTEMLHKQPRTELSARLSVPQARKQAAGGSLAALTNHSDQVDKSNELDLNIHLNSTPGKTVERSDEATSKKMWRVGDRAPRDQRERKDPSSKDPEIFSLISCKPPGSVGTHIDSVRRCDVDIVGDQSHPEIVMEQEELSDSEEDIEETVEFECEEMADSDGEDESDTDLPANSFNKAIQHPHSENPSALANDDHERESTAGHVDRQVKRNLLIAKLGPTGEVKDITSKSWLSLDPCAGGRLSNKESEQGANTICNENVDEGHGAPLSSRSRKRTRPNSKCDVAELRNQSIGCAKQEELDQVLSIGPLRRPRKRSCGKNASSNSVKAAENSNFSAKGNSAD